jgi:hypothetical protein
MLLVASAVWGCQREPPPAPAPVIAAPPAPLLPTEWTTRSHSGHATVTSRRSGSTCQLLCEHDGAQVWERAGCVAKSADLRFVSEDCATFVFLHDAPFVDKVLGRTTVGATLGATSDPVPLRLERFTRLSSAKLSQSGRWVAWLRGTMEQPGDKPRELPDGSGVGFETLDGEHHALLFTELAHWVDSPATEAPAEAEPHEGLYQWVDEEDATQITSYGQIPRKLRARATRLSGEISVMGGPSRPNPSTLPRSAFGPQPVPTVDLCATAQQQVNALQAELSSLRAPSTQNCQVMLGGRDMIGYTNCMAGAGGSQRSYEARLASLNQRLDSARDELRRAQVNGCR